MPPIETPIWYHGIAPIGGMRIVTTPHAIEHIADEITVIPISKNRSRRVWKKLRQRRMRNAAKIMQPLCYKAGDTLFMHPSIEQKLSQQLARRSDQMMTDAIYGRF